MFEKVFTIISFSLLFLFFFLYNVGRIFGLDKGYLAIMAVLGVFAFVRLLKNPEIVSVWRKWFSWQFVLISFMIISMLWAINPNSFRYITMMFILILKVSIVAILCNTPSKVKILLLVFSLVGFAVFIALSGTGNLYAYRAAQVTFLDNPNTFGLLCGIYLMASFYWLIISEKVWRKTIFIIFILLDFYMIMMTGGRKFLLFSVILFLAYYLLHKKQNFFHILGVLILGFIILSILQYFVMNVPVLYDAIGYRFDLSLYSGSIEGSDDQEILMREALKAWSENPILGLGPGGFQVYNTKYGNLYSHSNYTELLANFGLIGFIIYYSIYIYCIKIFLKYRSTLDSYGRFLFSVLIAVIFIETFSITYNQTAYVPLLIMIISTYCYKLKNRIA